MLIKIRKFKTYNCCVKSTLQSTLDKIRQIVFTILMDQKNKIKIDATLTFPSIINIID